VDVVFVMVPGLYPDEVMKTLENMNISVKVLYLKDNKILHIKSTKREK